MSSEVQYLVCGNKEVRMPQHATPLQVDLSYKRLAWMVHHSGLRFPAELARKLRENGMMRRNKGKKTKCENGTTYLQVSAEALLLIDMGNISIYIHMSKVIPVVLE